MPVDIRVPQLGESVVEATVAQWLKNTGDAVKAGDALVELETEKVNQVIEAEMSGVLGAITHPAGDTVGVGEVLGSISENGAGPASASAAPAATASPAPSVATGPSEQQDPNVNGSGEARTPATPVAARMAADNNVDLSAIKPTGPGGKIGKDDVATQIAQTTVQPETAIFKQQETAQAKAQAQSAPPPFVTAATVTTPAPAAPIFASTANGRPEERIKMSRRRETIARRLVEAQHNAAMLTTFNEVDLSAVMEIRTRRKDAFKERFGVGLGFMSFFTKASIGALKQFPYVNAEIQGNEIVLKKYYDIGIAVGAEEGLVVPVVRDADQLTFAGIEKKIQELAGKAKANTLTLSDLTGGTFTITNGGVYGSLMSTPILNAPQVGILGMHTIKKRAVVIGDDIVARPMMYIALSYDHRVIDGSTAVQFLVKIKDLLEDPETLLLEG